MSMSEKCVLCGREVGFLSSVVIEKQRYCKKCGEKVKNVLAGKSVAPTITIEDKVDRARSEKIDSIICSTTPNLEGYRIVEYLSIINVQVILGIDAWTDMKGSLRSWWGGRAKGLESELKSGFKLANLDLKEEAFKLDANAVIGVEFDGGMEIAGDVGVNDKMMVVSATGTAVKIEPLEVKQLSEKTSNSD